MIETVLFLCLVALIVLAVRSAFVPARPPHVRPMSMAEFRRRQYEER